MDDTHHSDSALVLPADAGEHFHFLNHLATVKVAGEGRRALSAVEFLGPRGFGPPLHRHQVEDELFVILDGEIRFEAGDTETIATTGATTFLPHGLPHTFQVVSETARFVTVTGSVSGAPRFDLMVSRLGDPTAHLILPEPGYIDASRVADVCREFGIEILGPPPSPISDTE
jgi:quercetin dioxygenase-like cupin family protein